MTLQDGYLEFRSGNSWKFTVICFLQLEKSIQLQEIWITGFLFFIFEIFEILSAEVSLKVSWEKKNQKNHAMKVFVWRTDFSQKHIRWPNNSLRIPCGKKNGRNPKCDRDLNKDPKRKGKIKVQRKKGNKSPKKNWKK